MEKRLNKPFDNYTIDEYGNVRSYPRYGTIKTIRVMKPVLDSYGYHMCKLRAGKNVKMVKIHRLVAMYFIPNPENKPTVNHIDGDKTNNNVNNLEWATPQEHADHVKRLGLQKQFGRVKVAQYDLQGNLIAVYDSLLEAGTTVGVSWQNISHCIRNYGNRKTAGGYAWKRFND